MNTDDLIYMFDAQNYYTGSSPRPINPVTGKPAEINPAVGTAKRVPVYNAKTQRARFISDNWILEVIPRPDPTPKPPSPTLAVLKTRLMDRVNSIYGIKMVGIANNYPAFERESWSIQIEESNRLLKEGESAITPWIDACSASRKVDRMELARRIVAKDSAFRQISGLMSGIRQLHEDKIDAIETPEEAATYNVNAEWPV